MAHHICLLTGIRLFKRTSVREWTRNPASLLGTATVSGGRIPVEKGLRSAGRGPPWLGQAQIRAAVIELGHEALKLVTRHPARPADLHRPQLAAGHQLVDLRLADRQARHDLGDLQQKGLHLRSLGFGTHCKRSSPGE